MMDKRWGVFVLLVVGLLTPVFCSAAVTGDCTICHTMHNSEDGAPVAYTFNASGGTDISPTPIKGLLKTDCLGCHSSTGAETIGTLGGAPVPIVFNTTEPTYPPDSSTTSTLAGGNFHWLANKGGAYGHDIYGISATVSTPPASAPGGVARTGNCVHCHGSLATAKSGCEGCHVAEHHIGGNAFANRVQGWYRSLGSVMLKSTNFDTSPEGVIGIESPDWEQSPSSIQHNSYQGSVGLYSSYLESGSINQKCAGCHGRFHAETLSTTTWIRHPVDVAIPNSGEFLGMTTYDPLVPVARPSLSAADANFSNINRGSDLVSCISCHRAHGSPYPAMLRWGYRDWPGIDSHTLQPAFNGCAVCHTNKS